MKLRLSAGAAVAARDGSAPMVVDPAHDNLINESTH
jgi:hypothetical protein